ncbi:MAG: DNA primase [Bacillota bacterium]
MAGFVPEEKLQEILEKVSAVQVFSQYVTLKARGKNLVGLCPFHAEDTPSFSVDPTQGLFYCFGCGAGGNLFSFLMRIENFSFREAVEFLSSKAGVTLEDDRLVTKVDHDREDLIKVNILAQNYFINNLWHTKEGIPAITYLQKRGITKQAALEYKLGYTLNVWDGLYKWMTIKHGISPQRLLEAGLINTKPNNTGFYDRFRNRLIFPIFDQHDVVVGFGGRVIDDKGQGPKYLNSPETKIFQKSRILYGLNWAKSEIRKHDNVILVEGYMDVITCHQHGVKNVVASLGTAFSQEHARLIKRYTKNVVVAYDADKAGQEAALRGLNVLTGNDCAVSVLSFPGETDPDDFIRQHGSERFMELLRTRTLPYIEYKIKLAISTFNASSPDGMKEIISFVSGDISSLTSVVEKEYYVRLLAARLGVSEQSIMAEIAQGTSSLYKNGICRDNKEKIRNNSKEDHILLSTVRNKTEKVVIKYLLENPEKIGWFMEKLGIGLLHDTRTKHVIEKLFNYVNNLETCDKYKLSGFYLSLSEEHQNYLSEIINTSYDGYSLQDCIINLKNNWYKQQVESIRREIAAAEEQGRKEIIDALVVNLMEIQKEWQHFKNNESKRQVDPNGRGDIGEGRK